MTGYIARIFTSFVDVPDKIAVAIYFSGCSIRCPGCHNKELWDMKKAGRPWLLDDLLNKIKENALAECVAFLGGEPTDQLEFLLAACQRIKDEVGKPIMLYSGREFEVLPEQLKDYMSMIVCGPYRQELHVENGWPASSNQRVFKREGQTWTC